jgi:hypothetical protein
MIARQFKERFCHNFTIMILWQQKTSHKGLVFNVFLVGTRGFEPPPPTAHVSARHKKVSPL